MLRHRDEVEMACTGDALTDRAELLSVRVSYDEFYRRSWTRTVQLAALLVQDASVAEELAQDAFIQVMSRWDTLREPAAYLHQCVVNASRVYHRHAGVVRQKLRVMAIPETTEHDFDELAEAVSALPFRQRAVVLLRYHCDLTEQQIAEVLKCRPGTVKSLAARALSALHQELSR